MILRFQGWIDSRLLRLDCFLVAASWLMVTRLLCNREYMLNDSSLSEILMILRFQVLRFMVWLLRECMFNDLSWILMISPFSRLAIPPVTNLRCLRESMLQQWWVTDINDFMLRHEMQPPNARLGLGASANVWVYYGQWYATDINDFTFPSFGSSPGMGRHGQPVRRLWVYVR